MTWGTAASGVYGSHAETSAAAPGTSWLLAEGSTVLGFQLFYLLQNPGAAAATATVRYLLPIGAPVVRTYELPPQEPDDDLREHRSGARVDRRVGRDHGDAADRGRARDVSQQRAARSSRSATTRRRWRRRRRPGSSARARPAPSSTPTCCWPTRRRSRRPCRSTTCATRVARSAGPTRCRPAAASASTSTASRAWMRPRSARGHVRGPHSVYVNDVPGSVCNLASATCSRIPARQGLSTHLHVGQ